MKFDDWWAGLTQAEQKMIGVNNAKFVWNSAFNACAVIAEDEIERVRPVFSATAHNILQRIRSGDKDNMPLFDDWPGGWKK
jgi:hypothetical protein